MTDRELLKLAAKAAGYTVDYDDIDDRWHIEERPGSRRSTWPRWNPLYDDGDAFRLAVKTMLLVDCDGEYSTASLCEMEIVEACGDDACAATRRAIVRAAAEIGRVIP